MTCTFVRPSFVRLSFVLFLLLTVPTTASAADAAAADDPQVPCQTLPLNIQIDEFLRDVVIDLLRKSPTFQRQCGAIAARRGVRIVVQAVWSPRLSTAPRARARIGHFEYGSIRATIEVPMIGDHAELIPHEFEHVLEQMERVDLAALSRTGAAHQIAEGVYETERARTAGVAASREFQEFNREPAVDAAKAVSGRVWRALRRPVRSAQRTSPALRR